MSALVTMPGTGDGRFVPIPLAYRFWRHVQPQANGCWEWIGARGTNGYGRVSVTPRMTKPAHRIAYELAIGPIPEGLTLDHLCRNRPCVNPAHLEPVTMRENLLRGVGASARNAAKTACIYGHPLDGRMGSGHRYCLTCNRAKNRRYRLTKLAEALEGRQTPD